MSKFMVLYRSPVAAMEMVQSVSPEEMREGMKQFEDWMRKLGDGLVEMGTPLGAGVTSSRSGNAPTPTKGGITGYSIIEAGSMDEALAMLEGHPHLGWDEACEIEVHEFLGG